MTQSTQITKHLITKTIISRVGKTCNSKAVFLQPEHNRATILATETILISNAFTQTYSFTTYRKGLTVTMNTSRQFYDSYFSLVPSLEALLIFQYYLTLCRAENSSRIQRTIVYIVKMQNIQIHRLYLKKHRWLCAWIGSFCIAVTLEYTRNYDWDQNHSMEYWRCSVIYTNVDRAEGDVVSGSAFFLPPYCPMNEPSSLNLLGSVS